MSGILTALAGIKTAIATAVDEYFNRVTLLLNTSSTNGAQNNTFLDSSTNNFTITRNGNTTQGTFTPFSQTGWSYYGPGSSQLSTVANPNLAFGTGAITFECWINTTSTSNMGMWGTTNEAAWTANSYAFNYSNGDIVLWNNSALWSIAVGTLHDGNWHHIAIVRSGTTWQVFADGVSKGTTTTEGSRDLGNNAWRVGIGQIEPSAGDTKFFIGYLSNMRVCNTAIYTSNFTPSTTPLTTTSQGVSSSNVKFLSLQSNRFIENSTNAIALTVFGTPSVQAFSPFAPTAAYDTAVVGGSAYNDGSGDYLTIATNANLTLGSSDFTIEFWYYPLAYSSGGELFSMASSGGTNRCYAMYTYNNDGTLGAYAGTGGSSWDIVSNLNMGKYVLNQWNHIAFTRSGSTFSTYLNGNRIATTTATGTLGSNGLGIFADNIGGTQGPSGYMGGARTIKGTALYTGATYTVPTAPFTAVTNTNLLLNFTNAGIYDSTAKNVLETVGNAQVSTTQAKWGTTSMYFDGTGDWLLVPNRSLFDFGSGSFTVEGWFYPTTSSPTSGLITKRANSGVYAPFLIETASSLTPTFYFSTTGSSWNSITSSISFTINTWNHFAITRNGSTFTIWINGSSGGTASTSSALMTNTDAVSIGASGVNGDRPVVGYMDDVRITNGLARYAATFTPATAAFPLQ